MIITRLSLGLGNNLFQYALGRRLAIERNTELFLDFSGENEGRRRYALDYISRFNMIRSVASKKDLMKIILLNKFPFLNLGHKNSVFTEKTHSFDLDVLGVPQNSYLTGYWQSEKYFKTVENTIRKDLKLKEPQGKKYQDFLDRIMKSNSISIHFRRDDFMSEKNLRIFNTCTPDYYHNAVSYLSGKISAPELFVFSDDIEWVKQNIKFNFPTTFVSGNGLADYQEIILMSACKYNIIANSTYSWWGAWLNDNPQKIVITPKKWFVDPDRDEKDLIPEEWIKI